MLGMCLEEAVVPCQETIEDTDLDKLNDMHESLQSIFDKMGEQLDAGIEEREAKEQERLTDTGRSIRG